MVINFTPFPRIDSGTPYPPLLSQPNLGAALHAHHVTRPKPKCYLAKEFTICVHLLDGDRQAGKLHLTIHKRISIPTACTLCSISPSNRGRRRRRRTSDQALSPQPCTSLDLSPAKVFLLPSPKACPALGDRIFPKPGLFTPSRILLSDLTLFKPYSKALRSNGTLLPRPALYFFGPPRKSLGRGNWDSSTNLHRRSWTGTILPFCPGAGLVGLLMLDPPFVRVYELGSSIDRRGAWLAGLPGGDAGGGGGAGADEGGGGGGAAGDARPKALRAACSASEGAAPFVDAFGVGGAGAEGGFGGVLVYLYGSYSSSSSSCCALEGGAGGGGGGGVDRLGARGAAVGGGGGGGAEGVETGGGGGGGAKGLDDGGGGGGAGGADPGTGGARAGVAGGGGARPEGLREDGGGMGGFFPGRGGFGFDPISDVECVDTMEEGRKLFLSAAIPGAGGGRPPGIGGAAPGGFGAAPRGGLGAELRDVSGSDKYGELLSLPVSTPPAFLSFGMPPANRPPNCGAALTIPPPPPAPSPPVSLLLLARFPGTGGARPEGGAGALPIPGTGGAPPMGGPLGPSDTFPICGADRSFTVTFFNLAPL